MYDLILPIDHFLDIDPALSKYEYNNRNAKLNVANLTTRGLLEQYAFFGKNGFDNIRMEGWNRKERYKDQERRKVRKPDAHHIIAQGYNLMLNWMGYSLIDHPHARKQGYNNIHSTKNCLILGDSHTEIHRKSHHLRDVTYVTKELIAETLPIILPPLLEEPLREAEPYGISVGERLLQFFYFKGMINKSPKIDGKSIDFPELVPFEPSGDGIRIYKPNTIRFEEGLASYLQSREQSSIQSNKF